MPRGRVQRDGGSSEEGLEKFFGELELAIMEIVWEQATVTVRDVLTTLRAQGRDLAYTTVMTIMGRLVKKGWLATDKEGRAYRYQAVRSRAEARAESVGSVLRVLLQDFGELTLSQFVKEVDRVDHAHLARLVELAQEASRGEGPGPRTPSEE